MKIIRIPLLEDQYAINSIQISYDSLYLALEGPRHSIWVFKYQDFKNLIESESSEKFSVSDLEKDKDNLSNKSSNSTSQSSIKRQYWFNEPFNCQKIEIIEHQNTVSCLRFLHIDSSVLISASFDKYIAFHKINFDNFSSERYRKLPVKQEITDVKSYPNDKFLFVGFINGEINVYSCDYEKMEFLIVGTFREHNDYLNSIALSPNIINNGYFASLSDKGLLILAKMNIEKKNTVSFNIIKKFPFEDEKHFSTGDMKKIDWSYDDSMIISVDHHFIQTKPIVHARLILLNDLENTQVLIGHVTDPLIAKFSSCIYQYGSDVFQLLATCDRASNIKIWKIDEKTKKASIFFSNDDFSDSTIRDMIFSYDGKYLFIVSSFGSISIIFFDLLNTTPIKNYKNNNNVVNKAKKRIVPEMISNFKPIIKNDGNNLSNQSSKYVDEICVDDENSEKKNNFNENNNNINNYRAARDYNSYMGLNPMTPVVYREQLYQTLNHQMDYFNNIKSQINDLPSYQKRIYNIEKLQTNEGYHIMLSYENKISLNMAVIKGSLSNENILYIKQINSTIKLFTFNPKSIAYYDNRQTINVFTILGTPLFLDLFISDVSLIKLCDNFLLIITNENQVIIYNFITHKMLCNNKLLCLAFNNLYYMQKINNVYFLGLNNIILEITESNVYSNVNQKKIIYYDSQSGSFTLSPNDFLTPQEKSKIEEKENSSCFYNQLLGQYTFDNSIKFPDDEYIAIDSKRNEIYQNFTKINDKKGNDAEFNKYYGELNLFLQKYKKFEFILKDFELVHKNNGI